MSRVCIVARRGLGQGFWDRPSSRVASALRESASVGKSCYHEGRRVGLVRTAHERGLQHEQTAKPCYPSDRLGADSRPQDRTQDMIFSALENSQIRARRQVSHFGEVDAASRRLKTDIATGKIEAVQHLEQAIADGSCTLQTVRMCLKGEYERLANFRRMDRASVMRSEGKQLARAVLDYIWTEEGLWGPLVANDGDSITLLCYFAMIEGLESLLTEWLNADVAMPFAPVPEKPHLWRGSLFRGIILAHCTHDFDNRLDEALQCFFRVLDHRHQLVTKAPPDTRPPIIGLGPRPAVQALTKEISSGLRQNTDESLYNRFVSFNEQHIMTRKHMFDLEVKVRLAILELYHPTRPSHESALEIFRTRIQGASTLADVKILRDKMAMSDRALKLFISRASELASRSNGPSEVALISEQGLRLQAVSTPMPYDSRTIIRRKR